MQRKYKAKGVEVIGIAVNDAPHSVRKFANKEGINYTILFGNPAVLDAYSAVGNGMVGLPTTFFVSRDGKVIDQHWGMLDAPGVEKQIELAIASRSS
jgi:peroxiredoxin